MRTPATRSPFAVLFRAFLAQFFSSESVTAEIQLHQTIIWILAFLITPGFFLMFIVLPWYHLAVIIDEARHTTGLVDETLRLLASVFVMWSTVSVGLITVSVWDSLSFDRRDAMVLGPMPVRGTTIVTAKLAALGAFLLGASTVVNLMSAVPFAVFTNEGPGATLTSRFVAHLAATAGVAIFVFSTIVMIRGLVTMLCGARLAARLGSLLQFGFVTTLLCLVMLVLELSPAQSRLDTVTAAWMPPAWYLGLFEKLLGSSKTEFFALADRALLATPIVVIGAIIVSVAGIRRQMQLALAPSATNGPLGSARVSRTLARWIVGGDAVARATSDFILMTIARNRAQQAPIAMNAAISAAIVVAGLSRHPTDMNSLVHPRTAVLWIPLVLAYWMTIGLRASFFVPSEVPAAWSFRSNTSGRTPAYSSAVRASMMAFVLPPALLVAGLTIGPLLGWRIAAWHALVVGAVIALLVQVIALTIPFIPFTRPYQPGHAKLRIMWPLYAFGMYVFAYWPARLEMRWIDNPSALLAMVALIAAAIATFGVAGYRYAAGWTTPPEEIVTEHQWEATTLDISRGARVEQ